MSTTFTRKLVHAFLSLHSFHAPITNVPHTPFPVSPKHTGSNSLADGVDTLSPEDVASYTFPHPPEPTVCYESPSCKKAAQHLIWTWKPSTMMHPHSQVAPPDIHMVY